MKSNLQNWLTRRREHVGVDVVATTVIVAFTVAAYVTVVGPVRDGKAMASNNSAHLASEREHISELSSTLASLHTQCEAAAHFSAGSLPQLGSMNDLNDRLAALTELAGTNNLQIDVIEPEGKSIPGPSVALTAVTFNGRGSYQNCTRFVHALRDSMKDLTISSIDVISAGADDSAILNLRLTWYSLPAGVRGTK